MDDGTENETENIQIMNQEDEATIKCVLRAALSGAVIGGVAGSVVPAIGSGVGAVGAAMGAALLAEPACRAVARRTIQHTSYEVPRTSIESFKSNMVSSHGIDESEAHYVAQVGFVYDKHFGGLSLPKASHSEVSNSINYLIKQKA